MTLMDFQLTFRFLFSALPSLLAFQLHMTEISGCSVETPVRILHCTQKSENVYLKRMKARAYGCLRVCR